LHVVCSIYKYWGMGDLTFACRMLDLQILRKWRFYSIARVLKTIKL